MNEDGFVFTIDAILMLIPIFIIVAALSGFTLETPNISNYYVAQDAMDTISIQDDSLGNLNTMAANITDKGNITIPGNVTKILNSFNTYNYNLTFFNFTSGSYLTLVNRTLNNKTMQNTNGTISTATRIYGNVTFKLYMWR